MASKIEIAKDLFNQLNKNKEKIQLCLGKRENADGVYISDSSIDKHSLSFHTEKSNAHTLYFDAYYGYYGNSYVNHFENKFFLDCLCEAINKNMNMLLNETVEIMNDKYEITVKEAKEEADFIYTELNKLN